MKTPLLLATLALLALPALAAAPVAGASGTVTVTLDVTLSSLPYKTCDVAVPAGADGGAVLDAAVASGCLDSWAHSEFPGFGRYVTCIDDVCEAVATFWAFSVDGAFADHGIDAYRAADGDTLGFDYRQWLVPL